MCRSAGSTASAIRSKTFSSKPWRRPMAPYKKPPQPRGARTRACRVDTRVDACRPSAAMYYTSSNSSQHAKISQPSWSGLPSPQRRHSCRRFGPRTHFGCGSAALRGGQSCPQPGGGNSGTGYEPPKLSCRQAHLLLVYDHLALWTPLPRTQTSALLLLQLLYESFAGRRTPASRGFPNPLHQGGVFDPLRQCLAPRPARPTPLPFCHIQNARAVNPAGSRLGTRPPPFRRLGHHAGPHRIALYIPQGLPLVPIVHGAGEEAVLPHMAGFTAPQVQPPRVVHVRPAQALSQRGLRGRNGDQMNMVPHEAIADDTYPASAGVGGQPMEGQGVIGVFEEDALAAVAALRDVMPAARDNDAGDACHGEYLWIWRGKTLIKFRGFVACPRNSPCPEGTSRAQPLLLSPATNFSSGKSTTQSGSRPAHSPGRRPAT